MGTNIAIESPWRYNQASIKINSFIREDPTMSSKPTMEELSQNLIFNSTPSKEVNENWNQITLSLASNGGYTIEEGRKRILHVIIKEDIDGLMVSNVKSFYVTKKQVMALQSEASEFSDEIERMLVARDEEERSIPVKKPETKTIEKKTDVNKALTENLKKGLDIVRKNPAKKPRPQEDDSLDFDDDLISPHGD